MWIYFVWKFRLKMKFRTHKLAIRWHKNLPPLPLVRAHKEKTSNGRVLVKKIDRPNLTFLSATIPHQMRPPDPKLEKVLKTPPSAVNLLLDRPHVHPPKHSRLIVSKVCVKTASLAVLRHRQHQPWRSLNSQQWANSGRCHDNCCAQ